ncbi:MAG: ATP-binding cassette domain-containing protein [gamma proteobacterium symbiont of Bathyaustriella thionipta]|nr:ATP-binding cassette domain-containing protein [gamma proteobacterium symbiont of Bathyaustriella thionipta]
MTLLNLRDASLAYGAEALLDKASLTINEGDRIALIGRNGCGKSTLLSAIGDEISLDSGSIDRRTDLRIAKLVQDVPEKIDGSVLQVVLSGAGQRAQAVQHYLQLLKQMETDSSDELMHELGSAQHDLENVNGWQLERDAESVISRLGLERLANFNDLSGGARRRVMLGRALLSSPQFLLLDEPTNHLDIASVRWLEKFLLDSGVTLMLITHDRQFLQAVANRIVELDRGQLSDWPGDYKNYLRRKEERENAESLEQARLDKKLAQEEVWIRQGIKARRTRNEGRVRALKALRQQHKDRRQKMGQADFSIQAGQSSGKMVAQVENLNYAWGDKPIARDFSWVLQKGDRVGLVGPNGVGKTTLIQLLLGELQPQSGQVKLGTRLQPIWFDQLRSQLNLQATVAENVADGSDFVELENSKRHVISYLQDFLFSANRARQPVSALSGGEKARLLLARLFARPSNVLILDEPTNDLDLETLEMLEDRLMDYQGTLLLVSHDRAFLDAVVTDWLVFEGNGRISTQMGDWKDIEPLLNIAVDDKKTTQKTSQKTAASIAAAVKKPKKTSYKQQLLLEQLPLDIEKLEAEQSSLQAALGDADVYKNHPQRVTEYNQRLQQLEIELQDLYQQWEALEDSL